MFFELFVSFGASKRTLPKDPFVLEADHLSLARFYKEKTLLM